MTRLRDDGIVVVEMFEKPSKALMIALRDFVLRHDVFVEARGAAMLNTTPSGSTIC